ncbi:hypothetical protein [Variovorax sp. PAMC26660]|uniref:hypothetical protein n=1 Tax=Variovorax sp. PAMC26660 TaxID=2762322 RepID=UPI00164D87C1|nr:hypothetical protein [Variovorax sp. PAMC26660]QNK68516.1 hypothetical protein H7F35_01850 [Variovorax sp. PAMC26660]
MKSPVQRSSNDRKKNPNDYRKLTIGYGHNTIVFVRPEVDSIQILSGAFATAHINADDTLTITEHDFEANAALAAAMKRRAAQIDHNTYNKKLPLGGN